MARVKKPRTPCPICGKPATRATRRYCSRPCAYEGAKRWPNSGVFDGSPNSRRAAVGDVRWRERPERNDGPRAWVKVAEPNKWRLRAVLVWEEAHGPVPPGMILHHENRDTTDDSLGNLEVLTRAQHLAEHRPEFEERRCAAVSMARWGHP